MREQQISPATDPGRVLSLSLFELLDHGLVPFVDQLLVKVFHLFDHISTLLIVQIAHGWDKEPVVLLIDVCRVELNELLDVLSNPRYCSGVPTNVVLLGIYQSCNRLPAQGMLL